MGNLIPKLKRRIDSTARNSACPAKKELRVNVFPCDPLDLLNYHYKTFDRPHDCTRPTVSKTCPPTFSLPIDRDWPKNASDSGETLVQSCRKVPPVLRTI